MKFLIIGCGMIGRVHAEALRELGLSFDVCDANAEFAKKLAEDTGAGKYYDSYEEAVERSGADAAIVCTPNHLHAAPAVFAMEHGLHVLCEKPLASSLQDADRICEAQKRTGKILMVGYPVRCYPALEYVKKKLNEGKLGRVISSRCLLAAPATLVEAKTPYRNRYETGGGIIYDYTHEIDYMRYLLGEPDKIAAFCGSFLNKELTVDDNADMLIHFENGPVLELHMDYVQWTGRGGGGRSFEIVLEKGIIECNFKNCRISTYDGEITEKDFGFVWAAPFKTQINRFMDVVNGAAIDYVTAEDGRRVLEIAAGAYASARENKFIEL